MEYVVSLLNGSSSCWPKRSGPLLAFALGGSSDIVGALAMARALDRGAAVVLVQPGSPPKGDTRTEVAADLVRAVKAPAVAPGGNFFDNGSMVEYLLSSGTGATAGYYLRQPKDDGKGFSAASLERTTVELARLASKHGCSAIVGLDFGGDVALPTLPASEGDARPFLAQRDMLNLLAASQAARRLGLPTTLVAVSPGVDAAAVAPAYAERLAAADGAAVPVLTMTAEGELAPAAPPAPACALRLLPVSLLERRLGAPAQAAFHRQLARLAAQILAAAPAELRKEHASKTYCLVAATHAEVARRGAAADFFVTGQWRGAEKARAHLHSSYALGIYDVSQFAVPPTSE